MRAKRYEARIEDYGDLLARIKDEMGTEVLVQTRRFKKGGLLGLFGLQDWVEVLAAQKPVEPRQAVKDSVEVSHSAKRYGRDNDQRLDPKPALDRSSKHQFGVDRDAAGARDGGGATRAGGAVIARDVQRADKAHEPPFDGNGGMSVKQEIRELKKMVEDLARSICGFRNPLPSAVHIDAVKAVSGATDLSSVEHETLSQVISWDIHPQRALKLIKEAVAENPYNLDTLTVEMLVKRIKKVIVGNILLAEGIKLPPKDEGLVVAFIGATGVGKTTTIAKLAAQFGVRNDRKVALVSLDTYRVGAQEQLRTYADIMRMPIAIVFNPDEFRHACDKYRKDHIVLVDTAGRSPFNNEHMLELRDAFRASPPDNIQLVIDACTKADDINIMLEKFSGIGFDHIIISKLDETGSLGSVYTINTLTNRPISYFNVGQSVPDDIRPATVDFIQRWINTGKF